MPIRPEPPVAPAVGRGRGRHRAPGQLRRPGAAQPRRDRLRRRRSGASTRGGRGARAAVRAVARRSARAPSTRSSSRSRPRACPPSIERGRRARVRRRGRVQRRLRRGRRRRRAAARARRGGPARYGLPVCGPNCNGIVAMHERTALWGDALAPREPGAVALISQSGNVAVNALATRRGLRFHTVVASGNQAVLGAADYWRSWRARRASGRSRCTSRTTAARGCARAWPRAPSAGSRVAVLKVGSSAAGARAAAAHSGALAGDQRIFRALIEEAGPCGRPTSTSCSSSPRRSRSRGRRAPAPRRQGLAIMTCSGGDSAQGADEAERLGVALPALAPATSRSPARTAARRGDAREPARLHRDDLGRREALERSWCKRSARTPRSAACSCSTTSSPDLDGAVKESWDAVREGIIAGAALSDGGDDRLLDAARAAR